MPRRRTGQPPKYRHHKARNLAKVTIHGRDIYLGPYNSPESWKAYADVLAAFQRGSSADAIFASLKSGTPTSPTERPASSQMTIGELALKFFEHAKVYYASRDGSSSGRVSNVRTALREVNKLYAGLIVGEFGPRKLQNVRAAMVSRGLARQYINDLISIVTLMFSWGVAQEFVPADVMAPLREVRSLRNGKTDAPEARKMKPVPLADFEKTLDQLSGVVRDMVQLQLLTAARASEIRVMTPGAVDRSIPGVWCYQLYEHKTEHHGKDRRIFIGPKAQQVLLPYLDRPADAYCFTTGRASNKPYSKDSYARAIKRACTRAKVTPWAPRQLRHSQATLIRDKYDLESAKVVLGHSDLRVTELYAQRDFEKAAQIMREIG